MQDAPPDQRFVVTLLPGDVLEGFADRIGFRPSVSAAERRSSLLVEIARTLSRSPAAADLDATVVVRAMPEPALAVLGALTPAQMARLDVLTATLEHRLREQRYLGYADAERAGAQLAQQLTGRLGRRALGDARFVAIPRGGHLVLGMLATILGLRGEQLHPGGATGGQGPCIVVDDCVLTGHRFSRWLQEHDDSEVVLATLCAPAPVPEAIEAAESERVLAVETAIRLEDLGPLRHGAGYQRWQQEWLERLDDGRYWIGEVAPVAFAWKEPDAPLWNPVTERREPGWRVLPAEVCLGNRSSADAEGRGPAVVVHADGPGPLRPAASLVHGTHGERTALVVPATGTVTTLEGVAAAMWEDLVRTGSTDAATTALLQRYDVDRETLERDLTAFAASLLAKGLLVEDPGAPA